MVVAAIIDSSQAQPQTRFIFQQTKYDELMEGISDWNWSQNWSCHSGYYRNIKIEIGPFINIDEWQLLIRS